MGLYLKAFRHRAVANVSGWGVAWYEGSRARVIKEAVRADESPLAAELAASPPTSSMFIVHVRAATVGRIALENTHPFEARQQGRHWTFAHNGTINGARELPQGEYRVLGDTDSEPAFYYLLSLLADLGPDPSDAAVEEVVATGAADLTARGKCNFLLSDGTTLFGYYDGHKTLHYVSREAADLRTVHVADDADYTIDLDVADAPQERAVILASLPLTEEPWVPLEPGSLVVCRAGEVVSSQQTLRL